jgi:hypothetical protein
MSVRNGIVLIVVLCTISLLVGCGSSSPKVVPPPTGGFSPSNFNGNYVFSTAGFNVDGLFMTIAGTLVANGNLGITGTVDVITSDGNYGFSPNESISNGSYSLGADGRGKVNFTVTTEGTGAPTPFTLDFVLSSNEHGLITEFDGNGTGSGTIDLQTLPTQSQIAGAYSFSISGTGGEGSTSPFATVGVITFASGSVTGGFQDFNNGAEVTTNQPVSTEDSVAVGSGTAPGSALFFTPLGNVVFDVYAVDSTHLKLIEIDGQFITVGDVFTAAASLPASATLAFTMSGSDVGGLPLGLAGFIPLDANSNVLGGGLEDVNDGGALIQDTAFGGSFSALTNGRSVLTLTSFQNGNTNDVAGTYTFAAYPFTSNGVTGIELLEIDNDTQLDEVTSGVAYVQTGTDFAASQGYGFNLSAVNITGLPSSEFEEDDIAAFPTVTSTSLTGIVDVNDEGSPTSPQNISADYSSIGTGYYSATVNQTDFNFATFNLYAVNDSTFLMLETDAGQIGTGVVEIQNATAPPGGEPGIARPLARPGAHAALKHR